MDGTGFAIAQAARLAGMSVARVRALIEAGVVPARLQFPDLALLRQLSREPESGQQLLAFGEAICGSGDGASVCVIGRGPSTDPPTADIWVRRGRALEPHDPAAACDAYRRALELDPHHPDANINLGRLVHESGQADAAAELYRAALEARPDDPVAWFNLGVALGDLGDIDAALGCYRRVLGFDPSCADAHFNAARLCERRGDRLGTVRHLRAYRTLSGG